MKRFAGLYVLSAFVAVLISTGKYLNAQDNIPCETSPVLSDTNGAAWAKGTASNPTIVTTPSELHTLAALEVASIDLDYKLSKYKDPNGNTFKYRAKIGNAKGTQMGRWVYDVFLDARRISQ